MAASTDDVMVQSDVRMLFDAVRKQYPDILNVYAASNTGLVIMEPMTSLPLSMIPPARLVSKSHGKPHRFCCGGAVQ